MTDLKLFRIQGSSVTELEGRTAKLERNLQELVETQLETLLQVRLVASEYSTGRTHAGRIDTLGLDENHCPTIIEYKRNSNANVITQGLFYLDWLMDHRGEFELLVLRKFGQEAAGAIDWSAPRLLCLAADFTRYDGHAVEQMNRNIELIRYEYFGEDLFLLDLVNVTTADPQEQSGGGGEQKTIQKYTTQAEYLAKADPKLIELYESVRDYLLGLDDAVQERFLKWYIAYKRIRNFATLQLQTQKNSLLLWMPLNPDSVDLDEGFSRDVRDIGHHGTGDLELTIRDASDLERAKPLILRSLEET